MIIPYAILDDEGKKKIEKIFFENSLKTFSSQDEKLSFKEKWLGPYFHPDCIFLVLMKGEEIAGYVNGQTTTINTVVEFKKYEREYPAHLHINVANEFQGQGLGSLLIEEFIKSLPKSVPGVHIVTGAESKNIRFYENNKFICLGTNPSKTIVFMGRKLR